MKKNEKTKKQTKEPKKPKNPENARKYRGGDKDNKLTKIPEPVSPVGRKSQWSGACRPAPPSSGAPALPSQQPPLHWRLDTCSQRCASPANLEVLGCKFLHVIARLHSVCLQHHVIRMRFDLQHDQHEVAEACCALSVLLYAQLPTLVLSPIPRLFSHPEPGGLASLSTRARPRCKALLEIEYGAADGTP